MTDTTTSERHETERYEIGSTVRCTDAECGSLALVVVDPVAGRLAHLIVAPSDDGEPRLVPVSMAHAAPDGVRLDCDLDGFADLEPAVRTHFLPVPEAEERWGYGHDEMAGWPFFGLGPMGPSPGLAAATEPVLVPRTTTEDRVPADEVRIHRGDHVHATDGDVGKVRGLVVDAADDAVTHVLLDEGHLWGRKQVAIPVGEVERIDAGGVRVRLTKQDLKDLPPVDVVGLD